LLALEGSYTTVPKYWGASFPLPVSGCLAVPPLPIACKWRKDHPEFPSVCVFDRHDSETESTKLGMACYDHGRQRLRVHGSINDVPCNVYGMSAHNATALASALMRGNSVTAGSSWQSTVPAQSNSRGQLLSAQAL